MALVIQGEEGPGLTACCTIAVCQTVFLASGGSTVQFITRISGVILVMAP